MKSEITKFSLKNILIPCKKSILWSSTDTLSTAISLWGPERVNTVSHSDRFKAKKRIVHRCISLETVELSDMSTLDSGKGDVLVYWAMTSQLFSANRREPACSLPTWTVWRPLVCVQRKFLTNSPSSLLGRDVLWGDILTT